MSGPCYGNMTLHFEYIISQGDSMKMYLSSAFKFKAGLKIKQLNEHFSIRLKLPHVLCLPSVSVDINSLSI